MNMTSFVHNLYYRFEHFPRWPCTLVGIGLGAGLAALFLLDIGGLAGAIAYGVLLSLALWIGFKAQPVVDIELHKALSPTPPETPEVSVSQGDFEKPASLLAMVRIPGGSFLMGSSREDAGASDAEFPRHRVTLGGFEMAKFPVTREAYRTVMDEALPTWGDDSTPNYPASFVDWFQAIAFCNALSEREGLEPCYRIEGQSVSWRRRANGYRLPTEAEWEYAARAGTQSIYFFGDDAAALGEYAWYSKNSDGGVHPIGKLAANPWGLYDLLGNVWEWCWDWYGPYSSDLETDPEGPAKGDGRTLRGGSAWNEPRNLRSANRNWNGPEYWDQDVGFRCVRGPAASLDS